MSFGYPTPRSRASRGFTLVELLVVIGIIALLIGILLPTLSQARKSARQIVCGSNMRQIGQTAVFYANEYDGGLPHSQYTPEGGATPENPAYWWSDQFHHILDSSAEPFDTPDRWGNNSKSSREIFMCSEAPNIIVDPVWIKVTHYGTHPDLMPERVLADGTTEEKAYKLSQIENSSGIGLIFEETLAEWGGAGAYVPLYDVGRLFMIDGFRRFYGLQEYTLDRARVENLDLNASIDLSNFGGRPNTDAADNVHTVRFRHGNNDSTNILFVDGHVGTASFNPRLAPTDPNVTTLLRRNVYVNDID